MNRPRPLGCLLVCALTGLLTAHLRAQETGRTPVFPPTSEDYRILWRKIDGFAAEGDWEAVLEGLERYVELFDHREANYVVSNGASMAIGIRRLLRRYVDRLPPEFRERWTAKADPLLARPWNASSGEFLSGKREILRHRMLRDYPLSRFYPEALKEEIDASILEGNWARARRLSEELLEADASRGLGLTVHDRLRTLLILLASERQLGDTDSVRRRREMIREAVDAEGVDPETVPEPWRSQLQAALGEGADLSRAPAEDSGESARVTASPLVPPAPSATPVSFRLGDIIWRDEGSSAELRRFVAERATAKDGTRRPGTDVPLAYHPVAIGSLVIFQHDDRVTAFDSRIGTDVWTYQLPPARTPYGTARAPLCSEEACFFVHGNSVHAVDLRTGAPLWQLAVTYDRRESALRGDHVLGVPERRAEDGNRAPAYGLAPPVFFEGDLLVPAGVRLDGEALSFLVRLSPGGRIRWVTYLGSARSSNYLGLGAAASPPCLVGDTVVVLTNQGFLATVDAHDGTILWIKEYPLLTSRGLKEAIRDESRWHPNPVVPLPAGDEVLVAPQDSPFLLAVRLADGGTSWRSFRELHSTLLGHDGTRCFLAGLQLTAVALDGDAQGQALWTRFLTRLDAPSRPGGSGTLSERPLGRAILTPGRLLVSTSDALLHVGTETGRVIARDLWGFPGGGGNLLLLERHMAVIHPGGFLVYNDLEAERERIASLPAGRPATPLEQAKFELKTGDLKRGLAFLESWMRTKPKSPEPNSALDRLYLELAEVIQHLAPSASPSDRTRLLEAQVNVELRPSRKVSAAIQLALHLEDIGDRAGALAALHRALELDRPATEYTPDGALRVPSETFIRDRILKLRRSDPQPGTTFAAVEQAAMAELEEAHRRGRESKTTVSHLEVLRKYPYTRAAAQAYREIATYFLDYENYDSAAHFLIEYVKDFPDSPDAIQISLRAADLLYRGGRRAQAKERYRQLAEAHADARVEGVRGMEAGETVREYVQRRLMDPGLVDVDAAESAGLRVPYRMLWRSPADLMAVNRIFLEPAGPTPPGLEDAFITQSNEILECRDVETGLPLWTVHLRMIPGFYLDRFHSEFRFARSGDRVIQGRYVDSLLVLNDHRNLFAIDATRGQVRWHEPFGNTSSEDETPLLQRRLSERIRGVLVTGNGVYAATSRRRLYGFTLEGQRVWERPLDFDPARENLLAGGESVFVLDQRRATRSQKLHAFRAVDGEPTGVLAGGNEPTPVRQLSRDPLALEDGLALLPYKINVNCELQLVDLKSRARLWSYEQPNATVEGLFFFPDHPREVIATLNRANNLPAIVGISLRDGRELWRYEKFPARRTTLTVFRDENRLYVIHGAEQWNLLGLEISGGMNRGTAQVFPMWKPEPQITLGTFFGASRRRELHVTADSVIFPDPNTISVYDKLNGKSRNQPQTQLSRFLVEKGSFTSAVVGDRLVILSDGGDCAYGTSTDFQGRQAARRTLDLVSAYLAAPGKLESIVPLALHFFRMDPADGVVQAMDLLDRALTSERVLSSGDRHKREALAFLLDGFKEEAMKVRAPPELTAPRLRAAPRIDGELEESWNYAYRVRLASPRHIGFISGPGRDRDWEGEEDLSGVLYLGWDDENFYFALDVEDDVLRAYDRDADFWKGDCLLIGTDPDGDGGYRRGPGDQLMTLALTIPKRKKDDKQKQDDEEGEDGEDEEGDEEKPDGEFSVKKKEDNSGAIYEVALPWNSFSSRFQAGTGPGRGQSFGLSLLLTDDDTGGGATKTLSLNPCHLLPRSQKHIWIWKYLIPEFYPRIHLR